VRCQGTIPRKVGTPMTSHLGCSYPMNRKATTICFNGVVMKGASSSVDSPLAMQNFCSSCDKTMCCSLLWQLASRGQTGATFPGSPTLQYDRRSIRYSPCIRSSLLGALHPHHLRCPASSQAPDKEWCVTLPQMRLLLQLLQEVPVFARPVDRNVP
jgi:hypothetical protein